MMNTYAPIRWFCKLLTHGLNSCNLLLAAEPFKHRLAQPEATAHRRVQQIIVLVGQLHRRTGSTLRRPE
jgi:hypothetical protein